jgi:hypothetical protein
MKNIFTIIAFFGLVTITGCDAPQRTRTPYGAQNSNGQSSPTANDTILAPGTLSNTPGVNSTNNSNSSSNNQNFNNCDLSYKYQSRDMGSFGLCQSSVDEKLFRVKFSQTTTNRNCLIPLYKDATGSSTYIGQPQCTYVNQAEASLDGALVKNRTNFETYPLNGVIVMKEALLPEYFQCMNAYNNWLPQACPYGVNSSQYCAYWQPRCPNGAIPNTQCGQAASDFMKQICDGFKSRYSNSYVDIRTK